MRQSDRFLVRSAIVMGTFILGYTFTIGKAWAVALGLLCFAFVLAIIVFAVRRIG
jgi:hypothetical protein